MSPLILPKVKNIHIEFCKEITALCQPLALFNLNYFHFIRSYKDGSRLSLSNNESFSEYYYDKQFYLQPAISKVPNENKSTYQLWLTSKFQTIFQILQETFDISNGITITKHCSHYSDFYYFGSRPGFTEINNFYLLNTPLLERFITYFTDAASSVIKQAEKERIFIPIIQPAIESIPNPPSIYDPYLNLTEEFVKKTPIKKYKLYDGSEEQTITPRQMDCINGLLAGKTAKEIAREHELSMRTVENYINNLKIKFDCYKKNQLVSRLKSLF